jgi:CubicO group peptidase (beta-lactamase class C family)
MIPIGRTSYGTQFKSPFEPHKRAGRLKRMTAQTELALPRTRNVITRGINDGLHLGAQLYASIDGEIVADAAVGESRPGEPLRGDDLMPWLSSCKPVTAVAVMRQVERGRLRLDDPVAQHIPEFAQNGKDVITVRHLLTHTAGIRGAALHANGIAWDDVIAELCAAPIEPRWVVGETAGYHTTSSWYILGELVQRLSGIPLARYVREKIFEPLGMNDSWIGMPPEQFRAYGRRIAPVYDTSRGSFEQDQFNNTEAGAVMPRPASGGRGPMRELGRLYEMLRNRGAGNRTNGALGARVLWAESVEDMIRRHRAGKFDKTFGHVIDFGLGLILDTNTPGQTEDDAAPYGYGPYASEATFGHSGSRSSCAFCDPNRGLVVAWACNGMPAEPAHQRRQRALNAALYEDLGLAS